MKGYERRTSLRVPLDCKARIKVLGSRETYYGICRDLSVDGLLIESEYVPRAGQMLEVTVLPPQRGPIVPLHAVVQVRRCIELVSGQLYEIGAKIKEIKK